MAQLLHENEHGNTFSRRQRQNREKQSTRSADRQQVASFESFDCDKNTTQPVLR